MINNLWYKNNPFCWVLSPLMVIYCGIIFLRRWLYQKNILRIHKCEVPVIIVGNITVGGTGKTPFTIWLANYLVSQGFSPGIVSRGYGGKYRGVLAVEENNDVAAVGDEALIIYSHTNCPVVVAKNRVSAVKKILTSYDCDIIISDDGLQHYALGRDLEIVVIDGERRFGNGLCLPAGPLREPIKKLKEVDFVVVNGNKAVAEEYAMQLLAKDFCSVADARVTKELSAFNKQKVHAVAGIGNPQRFFNLLRTLGFEVIEHAFPDHYWFKAKDLNFGDNLSVIMTEKDAVKCQKFAKASHWFLRVEAQLEHKFITAIKAKLSPFKSRREPWQSNLIYGLGGW